MKIEKKIIGQIDDKNVYSYTLVNSKGMSVTANNYGCQIIAINVPDRNGVLGDVVLAPPTLEGCTSQTGYLGVIAGRHANRIKDGVFSLGDKTYNLYKNDEGNHLHGGKIGFDKKVWHCRPDEDQNSLIFSLFSPDMDEGYPGNLIISVSYTLTEENALVITYHAQSDADTVINLTNHTYFNLKGHDAGSIENHLLKINADRYTEIDENCLTTGVISFVEGTPFDFRQPKRIGKDINADNSQIKNGLGYDHNFILRDKWDRDIVLDASKDELALAVVLKDEDSGRVMETYTTMPGIQLYTGNMLDGVVTGKGGHMYVKRDGLCLETQVFPNAMEHTNFPSPVLKAGGVYSTVTVYKFRVE